MHPAPDILQVQAWGVSIHILRRANELVLIDTGFIGGPTAIYRALKEANWHHHRITGIILTHGHLDHTLNAHRLAREFGAWVAAPRADESHITGDHQYSGSARVCGALEAIGSKLLNYEVPQDIQWYDPGHTFDWLDGLQAIPLPGHTIGHTGLYSAKRKLLLSGDLFASFKWSTHLPPAILNTHPENIPSSLKTALALDLEGVLPAHCDRAPPAMHLARLQALGTRASRP